MGRGKLEIKHVCFICGQLKPSREGGMQSTGNINRPVMQWICNQCLMDKVCP